MTLSILRLVAVLLGAIVFYIAQRKARTPGSSKINVLLQLLVAIALIVIGVFPSSLDFLFYVTGIDESGGGRLVGLLIITTIFLFFLNLYVSSKVDKQALKIDHLTRKVSISSVQADDLARGKDWEVVIVIPAYNEADNLPELLSQMPTEVCGRPAGVVLIDDCSKDNTFDVASSYPNVIAVRNIINRGQGGASRAGYDLALKLPSTKVVAVMDADNQHRVEDLPVVVSPILDNEADFIVGSRRLGLEHKEGSTAARQLGISFLSWISGVIIGQKITDVSSGFKGFRRSTLETLDFREEQFQAAETLIHVAGKGARIKEVPIVIRSRFSGESKKGSDWRYGFGFVLSIIVAWWRN